MKLSRSILYPPLPRSLNPVIRKWATINDRLEVTQKFPTWRDAPPVEQGDRCISVDETFSRLNELWTRTIPSSLKEFCSELQMAQDKAQDTNDTDYDRILNFLYENGIEGVLNFFKKKTQEIVEAEINYIDNCVEKGNFTALESLNPESMSMIGEASVLGVIENSKIKKVIANIKKVI